MKGFKQKQKGPNLDNLVSSAYGKSYSNARNSKM